MPSDNVSFHQQRQRNAKWLSYPGQIKAIPGVDPVTLSSIKINLINLNVTFSGAALYTADLAHETIFCTVLPQSHKLSPLSLHCTVAVISPFHILSLSAAKLQTHLINYTVSMV